MTNYLKITIHCRQELHDRLIAELSMLSFDSFQESDESLEAYIDEQLFDENILTVTLKKYGITEGVTAEKQENINWNEEWEKNFEPVYVDGKVQIRAVFHEPKEGYDLDIVIQPKMSFGTGHHETTYLVTAEQLKTNHKNKRILDVGTGTGILAITAKKLGAASVTVTDIDDWCIENSRENFELNGITDFEILQGTIDKLTLTGDYDIIFANINKNVLLEEIPLYAKLLTPDGTLLLSGFYSEDIADLSEIASKNGLTLHHIQTRNNWALMSLSHA